MKKEELEAKIEERLDKMNGIDGSSATYSSKSRFNGAVNTHHFKVYVKARKIPVNPHCKLGHIGVVRKSDVENRDFKLLFHVDADEIEGELQ